jgi:hypothetical protein
MFPAFFWFIPGHDFSEIREQVGLGFLARITFYDGVHVEYDTPESPAGRCPPSRRARTGAGRRSPSPCTNTPAL